MVFLSMAGCEQEDPYFHFAHYSLVVSKSMTDLDSSIQQDAARLRSVLAVHGIDVKVARERVELVEFTETSFALMFSHDAGLFEGRVTLTVWPDDHGTRVVVFRQLDAPSRTIGDTTADAIFEEIIAATQPR